MRFLLLMVTALALGSAPAFAEEYGWPQQIDADNGATVIVYQPQIEEFTGNALSGRAAVSVSMPDDNSVPTFGAIWFEARMDTDRESRTAVIRSVKVANVRFADASDAQKERLAMFLEQQLQASQFTISVDQLLVDLNAKVAGAERSDLQHTPPKIMLSTEPALLVMIDGEPVFREIEGSRYERVVNSPFLIARGGKDLYLYIGSNAWYSANDIDGPWARAKQVPADVSKLVEPSEDDDALVDDVRIIISQEPAELIVSDGEPSWAPVEGMDLLYMQNTDSNAFLELSTQKYYVLLSGRWYLGDGIVGDLQWTHVPNDELPGAFADVPEDSVNGAILSQVAGTEQAREAILDNTIPQTAAIDRADTSFSVEYDGAPEFAPVEDIEVEYAQNTSAAVFKYGSEYYACDDGVWYVAKSPTGDWRVATEVPDAIYEIPASNPHHNVTYVKVYDVTPEVVYVGYTPGYYGSYFYGGSVVYGSGYYYNPWYGPYYYPRYPTWGFHVTYNPWYGWGFGVSWTNGPFRFTFTNPGGWWGVGGYRPYPRPVAYGGYNKNSINANINNSVNIGGANLPEARPNVYNRAENQARIAERPTQADNGRARPADTLQNNVLTDSAGNVYQRDASNGWQQRNDGQWAQAGNLDRPAPTSSPSYPANQAANQPATRPQLERDYNARQQGATRSRDFQRQQPMRRRR